MERGGIRSLRLLFSSGSVVRAMVSAIDGNNDPVTLTISSNRSGGLLKTGFDTMEMTEAFYHGDSANGPIGNRMTG